MNKTNRKIITQVIRQCRAIIAKHPASRPRLSLAISILQKDAGFRVTGR